MNLEDITWAWVEITRADHGHGGKGWEFGKCLWSPTKNRAGHDRYSIMREPNPNDAVLHFLYNSWEDGTSETRLCGISTISQQARIEMEPPNAGQWSGRGNYYRIELENFTPIQPGLPANVLTNFYANEILLELQEDSPHFYPFTIFGKKIRTIQGIYLARATPRLVKIIQEALLIANNNIIESSPEQKTKAKKAKKNPVAILNARQRTAVRIVKTVIDTVKSANGQTVERTLKNKEMHFTEQELEKYIYELQEAQEGLCAITGIRLQYDGEADDSELKYSLDRIDSDGPYARENLQLVCCFVNRWKNNSKDSDFRRLIDLVKYRVS